jgi:hypothetical protein
LSTGEGESGEHLNIKPFSMTTLNSLALSFFLFFNVILLGAQPASISNINLAYDEDFSGFDVLDTKNGRNIFVIAEDMHNRRPTPAMCYKLLRYLHEQKDIRVFAIEHGTSTAFLLNRFLSTGDTTLLREITRHSFFWSIEHFEFWVRLYEWNTSLSLDRRVIVESADIEIKQESVVLAMNILLQGRSIPEELSELQEFQAIYREKESHRNKFAALNTRYYYDKQRCANLTHRILADLQRQPSMYKKFFGNEYELFRTMMTDLSSQYEFDYKTGVKFMFRDDIMYQKLLGLCLKYPAGFFHLVGGRHTQAGTSSYKLKYDEASPAKGKVAFINLTARKQSGKYHGAKVVTKAAQQSPEIFQSGKHVVMRNTTTEKNLFEYTIAYHTTDHVQAFPNSYTGSKLKK